MNTTAEWENPNQCRISEFLGGLISTCYTMPAVAPWQPWPVCPALLCGRHMDEDTGESRVFQTEGGLQGTQRSISGINQSDWSKPSEPVACSTQEHTSHFTPHTRRSKPQSSSGDSVTVEVCSWNCVWTGFAWKRFAWRLNWSRLQQGEITVD